MNTYGFLESSQPPPPTYSLQDALFSPSDPLYTHACQQEDGLPNCTAACTDPAQVFSTLANMHNCAMYPLVASIYANHSLSDDAIGLADRLLIKQSMWGSQLLDTVNSTMIKCLNASCKGSPDCMQTIGWSNYGWDGEQSPCWTLVFRNRDLCDYIIPSSILNTDIGGIGVSWCKQLYNTGS